MLKRFFKTDAYKYALYSALIGAFLFFLILGFNSLIPENVSFIYDAKDRVLEFPDMPCHQLAIDYYLRSPWTFPLGTIPSYPYPYDTTVLLTDCLPLFAMFFKLFAPVLPEYFQYFGLWMLLCFMLQATAGSLLMRKLGMKLIPTLCTIPLFIINVPFMFRCFHHCSLCAQWLILFALLGLLYTSRFTGRERCIFWSLLCGLSVLIHGYLTMVVGIIMAVSLLYLFLLNKKNFLNCVATVLASGSVSVLLYYICNGFSEKTAVNSQYGWGFYVFDPSFLIDPYIFSSFFSGNTIPGYNTEHDEYLGAAVLLLALVSVTVLIIKRKAVLSYIQKNLKMFISVTLLCLILTAIALSPVVQVDGKIMLNFLPYIPVRLFKLLSIFRSSSRFFWPVFYLLILAIVFSIYMAFNQKRTELFCSLVLIATILQYIELVPCTIENKALDKVSGYHSVLDSSLENCLNKQAKHMLFISTDKVYGQTPGVYAVHHGMSYNISQIEAATGNPLQDALEDVQNGLFDDNTLYIIPLYNASLVEMIELPEDYNAFMDEKYIYFCSSNLLNSPLHCTQLQ